MAHRIREAMTKGGDGLLGSGGGTVKADETFWGNNKRRGASKEITRLRPQDEGLFASGAGRQNAQFPRT